MDATIKVHINSKLREHIVRRNFKKGWVIWFALAFWFFIVALMILGLLMGGKIDWSQWRFWSWFVAVPMILPIYLLIRRKMIRNATQSRWGDMDVTYRITDEAIYMHSSYETATIPWRIFPKLQRFPDLWLLYTTRINACILPVAQLTDEVREFIVRKVRENGGKVQ